MNRDLLIRHIHIPKTGGGTVLSELRRLARRYPYFKLKTSEKPIKMNVPINSFTIATVREPILMLLSAVYHDSRQIMGNMVGDFSLRDALDLSKHVMHGGKGDKVGGYENYQSKFLLGEGFASVGMAEAIVAMKATLDKIDVVGDPMFMRETICLIYYKLSLEEFKSCTCSSPGPRVIHPGGRNPRELKMTYKEIAYLNQAMQLDIVMHSLALQRLFGDIRKAEELSGRKILC